MTDYLKILLVVVLISFTMKNITFVAAASTSRLQVHIPSSLNTGTKDGYDHRDALFGIPPYGASIQEPVFYTTDLLCGTTAATPGTQQKLPPNKTTPNGVIRSYPDTKGKPWPHPFILMVDRGDCTFVQKVRNAQKGGAAAVLIADNECQCGAADCQLGPSTVCETQEPIMADDGSGSDISIPSFLVFKQDADKMKAVLLKNQPIRVEMSFSIPDPEARVEYDLWTTPTDTISQGFLATFKEAAIALGDRAFFTPRNYIYDGIRAGCQDQHGKNQCFSLCTNEGRYCSTDPDDDIDGGISGADVVKESLRRSCIWNIYGQDGTGIQWWDYVAEFQYRCYGSDNPQLFNNDACIADAMTHANVSAALVDQCMSDSGGLIDNKPNQIFDLQLTDKETAGAFLIPSMFINQAPIRGELAYSTVFKAICAGYATGYEPTICKQCANCNDESGCVEQSGRCTAGMSEYAQPSVTMPIFGSVLAGLTLVFCCVGYLFHRRQQRLMNEQIRGIVAEYMPVGSQNLHKDNTLGLDDDFDEGFT